MFTWRFLALFLVISLATCQDVSRQERRRRLRPDDSRVDASGDTSGNQTSAPAEVRVT